MSCVLSFCSNLFSEFDLTVTQNVLFVVFLSYFPSVFSLLKLKNGWKQRNGGSYSYYEQTDGCFFSDRSNSDNRFATNSCSWQSKCWKKQCLREFCGKVNELEMAMKDSGLVLLLYDFVITVESFFS